MNRVGLYDLLRHVSNVVEIKVMTANRVIGDAYQQRVSQFAQHHPDIEVGYLSDRDWDLHDRYIIRDQEDGLAWGHSFTDAGNTQHPASEFRPVNRESIESQFTVAWQNGTVIV